MAELTNGHIRLREFSELDQVRLAELCNNKKIWDNVRDLLPSPYTEQNALEFIRLCRQDVPTTTFAIEYQGELAGCIGLVKQTDVYRLSAEIGYWIGEPYWGLGIATEAVGLLTEYGFGQLDLVRIFTGVFDFNKASQRVLEKSGFKLEGVFEKSVIKNGLIHNEFRYAKLNPSPDHK
ncbi:MAG: GNAT family N-acetyltransferase [Prolixibacteraceae bacterium]|nr:GNAT family N-acetyltransferase [Prolixibacteraceae bacterium]